jgi:hypothetical protein
MILFLMEVSNLEEYFYGIIILVETPLPPFPVDPVLPPVWYLTLGT